MAKKKSEELTLDMSVLENQHIVNVEINQEMQQAYMAYAMSVIVSRALPDVRDGLKPVHRRILYDMYESNLLYENDFRKSATTVGNVLGKYHPHGDSSVYDAMVRLAQSFSMRYPLVQGKGNFGSVDGDPAAAYRYTEAKMSRLAAHMLSDIEKETVDFVPNFDDTRTEPSVLTSRFPNLLVNGSSGIAVGMATNMPPHNLSETIDGIIATMDNPYITIEELMTYIKGPDFPTGGLIMGKSGIRNAYTTGRGRVIMRARTEIEETKDGRERIVITELPYQVNKSRLEVAINELKTSGKVEGIASTRDESTADIRLVVDIKREANASVVLNNLFKYTQLQETFGVIMLALVDQEPKVLNLREMIDHYIAHQKDVITRRTQFDLAKAKHHAHILEGYKIVIDFMDEVIKLIRAAQGIPEAKTALEERFGLDDEQATAIVQMQLGRLSGMEREKIEADYEGTLAKIADLESILADEGKVIAIIKDDLLELKQKFGDERRTEISAAVDTIEDEDLIDEEQVMLTLTHQGRIKRLPIDTYKTQHRGGRGISGMSTQDEDFVEHILTTSTHNTILFFTTKGMVYRLKGYQIPESSRQAQGKHISNYLVNLDKDEKVTAMIPISEFATDKYLIFITRNGTVKKTNLMSFEKIRQGGLRAIELAEGDELMRVKAVEEDTNVIIGTHNGMAIRFVASDVRPMGRTARGVRGIRLSGDDYVIGASIERDGSPLLVVTENGYGKKTELDEYKVQNRGGKGILTYKITEKTGNVVGMKTVTDEDDLMMITSDGIVIRLDTQEISTYSRNTQGVRLMRLGEDVRVVSIALEDKEE